jgi:dTDP-4-dehydrorhamnose reductase
MKNFLVLGGSGNLGSALKKNRFFSKYSHFPLKKDLDILSLKKFLSFIKKKNIKLIINCAAVARMRECEKNRLKAFDTNVFGTLNLLKSINKIDENIKLVHISSDAVYPCKKGNYSEQSKLQPYNFYGYTKLLSEKIILNSKNYMIIRTRFFDKNKILFSHSATDSFSSSIEINQLVKHIKQLINKNFNGIINVGGKKISDYNLYKKFKKEIKKCKQSDIQKELEFQISKDASMNCKLLKNVLNDKK